MELNLTVTSTSFATPDVMTLSVVLFKTSDNLTNNLMGISVKVDELCQKIKEVENNLKIDRQGIRSVVNYTSVTKSTNNSNKVIEERIPNGYTTYQRIVVKGTPDKGLLTRLLAVVSVFNDEEGCVAEYHFTFTVGDNINNKARREAEQNAVIDALTEAEEEANFFACINECKKVKLLRVVEVSQTTRTGGYGSDRVAKAANRMGMPSAEELEVMKSNIEIAPIPISKTLNFVFELS